MWRLAVMMSALGALVLATALSGRADAVQDQSPPPSASRQPRPPVDPAAEERRAAALYRAGRIAEARAIWEALAADGHPRALYNLAGLYLEGRGGLPRDRKRAIALLRQAAAAGEPMAAYRLALLLLDAGTADDKDRVEGLRLLTQAASAGLPAAQYRLALAYWQGELLARDPVAAYLWMARAARRLALARTALRRMESAMTPGERERARARLAEGDGTADAADTADPGAAFALQIVALRDRAAVEAFWRRMQEKAGDLVADLKPRILAGGSPGHPLYRLRLGPLPTRQAAERRCAALKSAGFDCLLVKLPSGQ